MLFAIEGEVAWTYAGVAGGLIAIAKFVWDLYEKFTKDRREATKQSRVDTIAELKVLYDILKGDYEELKKDVCAVEIKLDESEKREHECGRKTERMSAHIFYLEDVLQRSGSVAFKSWSKVQNESHEGSGTHALPTPDKPPDPK